MSATIPNGMLLSDLLKATGYDCPATLAGKTFAQATAGAGIDLEANHASSINVSTYTQAVEITPSDTYEAMEKVTLTLTQAMAIMLMLMAVALAAVMAHFFSSLNRRLFVTTP